MIKLIIKEVNAVFDCDILSKQRIRSNVDGRKAFAAYVKKRYPNMALEQIGKLIKKDHATIMHYLKEHDNMMMYDVEYKEKYDKLSISEKPKRWLCPETTFRNYEKVLEIKPVETITEPVFKLKNPIPVMAVKKKEILEFQSMSSCAVGIGVSKSSFFNCVKNKRRVNGYKIILLK